jgi:chemotaxis protein methyltransferase CheR
MNYIKRRVAVRMRAAGSQTYSDYLKVLQRQPGEISRLFDSLTIHVTEFFRDPKIYRVLEEKILPDLSERVLDHKIQVWCAGCSTGEEPYSFAHLLEEWVRGRAGWSYEIHATDIDEASVRKAIKAEYPLESLGRLPKEQAHRAFRVEGSVVKPAPRTRGRVRFQVQDLLGPWEKTARAYDLISCRNLLIYLTSAQQQKLYERFFYALRPGGYLILGLTETILGEARRFFKCVDLKHKIYQAAGAGSDSAPLKEEFHG